MKMKALCAITKVPYQVYLGEKEKEKEETTNPSPPKLTANLPHPIFTLTKKDLVSLKHQALQGSRKEKFLFLVSYLKHYESLFIIEYYTLDYEKCSLSTLELIPRLMRSLDTLEQFNLFETNLPILNLASEPESIDTLKAYLDLCVQEISEHKDQVAYRLREREFKVEQARKEAHKIRRASPQYASKLTKWLFSNVDFPHVEITGANRKAKNGKVYLTLVSYWEDLFRDITKDRDKVFSYPKADLDTLIDFLLENLENSCPNSNLVYAVLKEAEKEYFSLTIDTKALVPSLGSEGSGDGNGCGDGTGAKTSEAKERNAHLKGTTKPCKSDYHDLFTYLKALASWKIVN